MDREAVVRHMEETYGVVYEQPWADSPENYVFRHKGNRKWFAIAMRVEKNKIGLPGEEKIDIMNVKCEKEMIPVLLATEGYFPAYHMNKANWITFVLDERLPDETMKNLIDLSFELTR